MNDHFDNTTPYQPPVVPAPTESFPVPPIEPAGPVPTPPPGMLSEASLEQRRQALAMAVAGEVAAGGRVESQTDINAVLVFGSKPNHTLHLLLTLATCSLWGVVWLIVAVAQQESRVMLAVDPYGQVLRQQLA